MAAPRPPSRPIKILMLHGYTQSGPLFRAKTRALEKNLAKAFPAGVTLSYPTAPIRLSHNDISLDALSSPTTAAPNGDQVNEGGDASKPDEAPDAWAWWRRGGSTEPYLLEGLDLGLGCIADVLQQQGPFDGVIGFSQGGAATALVTSLLESGRQEAFEKLHGEGHGGIAFPASFLHKETKDLVHPPFKFAVSYSGFCPGADHPAYAAFYNPKICTPFQHFLGSLDTVVSEERSLKLAATCETQERIVYHPGGHFLPSSQKQYVGALIGFIKEVLATEEEGKIEESVEDMDVPF